MDDPNTRFIFYMVLVCEPTKGIGRTGETFSPVLVEISVAGQSLPAAGSGFSGVDCASIFTVLAQQTPGPSTPEIIVFAKISCGRDDKVEGIRTASLKPTSGEVPRLRSGFWQWAQTPAKRLNLNGPQPPANFSSF
jgi:hypothetical protein